MATASRKRRSRAAGFTPTSCRTDRLTTLSPCGRGWFRASARNRVRGWSNRNPSLAGWGFSLLQQGWFFNGDRVADANATPGNHLGIDAAFVVAKPALD